MCNFKIVVCAALCTVSMLAIANPSRANEPIPSEIMPLALSAQINDLAVSDNVEIGVGERGIILRRVGRGAWQQIQSPVSSLLNAVFLIGKKGWAVGHDAVILMTQDAGLSWTIAQRNAELQKPFLDIHFTDEKIGFAVGAFGLFMNSIDGGKTWRTVQVEEFLDLPPHLNAIRELNDKSLLIVGEMGTVAHSTDGQKWHVSNVSYEGSIFTIVPAGKKGAVVGGMRGNTFFTQNPAMSPWQSLDLGSTKSVYGGDRSGSGDVYLAAGNEIFRLRKNDGQVRINRLPVDWLGDASDAGGITTLLVSADEIVVGTYSGVRSFLMP
ncbi:MAG: hypothetical protein EVA65_13550 [Oceanococcus sp.]|nr:MAG: hypothetical protein EVA65_13550 [Oceanococcus sp.]